MTDTEARREMGRGALLKWRRGWSVADLAEFTTLPPPEVEQLLRDADRDHRQDAPLDALFSDGRNGPPRPPPRGR
jgi:hypothetical protein